MRIVLDAQGSDNHPRTEVAGALAALRELPGDFVVALVGDRDALEAALQEQDAGEARERIDIVHAPTRVEPSDSPATVLRRKPDASLAVGLKMIPAGEAEAFISAGSTGAVMAGSLFILRPVEGVDRPSVATVLPTAGEPLVMLDAGANVDCKPHQLLQFARLGAIYAEDVLGRESPRVGLLNIGEEPEKGDERSVAAYQLLADSELEFVGNIEGRDVIKGHCDVLVTDGFAGNVLLKFYEAVASFVSGLIRDRFPGADPEAVADVTRILDYTESGGAPLLGVNGVSIICHGGSPPRAIRNAIRVAIQSVEADVVGHIRREVALRASAAPAGREDA
ncbi:MAG TPA: phosphate acyltransferase PlsX [Longimicrobiales bacterium]|nr:phosphate acyltransferase PlsX [Longimicrobiales bacterium]